MKKTLHDLIKNIYDKIIKPRFRLEIWSDEGWNKVKSVNKTEKQALYEIKTAHHQLVCTKNHILIDAAGNEILAIDAVGKKVKTDIGEEVVDTVKQTGAIDNAYDVSIEDVTNHLYYANGLLSHNCIICDEFAFLLRNLADKLFTSMYPTISSSKNGKFIIVSTPNGTDNLYYDIWCQANSKDKNKNLDGWKPFEMFWWQVPGHDEEWKKKQIAAIGERRFALEFNNEFLADKGSSKLIPGDVIERFRQKLSEVKAAGFKPKKQRIVSQDEKEIFEFEMWHEFLPQKTYAASMDISEGVGADASVLYIWDVTDLSDIVMCAKFSSNTVSLVLFAYISRKMLALYNDPYLAAERNGVSAGTLDSLKITYEYPRIVAENKKGESGIYSHVTVKERACLWARQMATTKGINFTLYDKELIDEFDIFCKKDGKGNHSIYLALPGSGSHDDHVMAFIWLTWILSLDLIDRYFLVCLSFTDDFGNVLPKILQPLDAYTAESWRKIKADPMYRDFLEYKDESMKHCKMLHEKEMQEERSDIFMRSANDGYFGDEWGGDSWNGSGQGQSLGPLRRQVSPFYVI